MKTLTPTKARKNLSELLSRAVRGEDIGIVHAASGQIVALRPVQVYSEDYALVEYGLTKAELKRAVKNIKRLSKNEKSQRWDGTAKGLLG
jgi:antitoxin (DNA-binding transcriptional repressor) of toxin-antitoxin stability system